MWSEMQPRLWGSGLKPRLLWSPDARTTTPAVEAVLLLLVLKLYFEASTFVLLLNHILNTIQKQSTVYFNQRAWEHVESLYTPCSLFHCSFPCALSFVTQINMLCRKE